MVYPILYTYLGNPDINPKWCDGGETRYGTYRKCIVKKPKQGNREVVYRGLVKNSFLVDNSTCVTAEIVIPIPIPIPNADSFTLLLHFP